MAGLETSEETTLSGYDQRLIHSPAALLMGITISIEINHHTTSIIHTTLHDARVYGQQTHTYSAYVPLAANTTTT